MFQVFFFHSCLYVCVYVCMYVCMNVCVCVCVQKPDYIHIAAAARNLLSPLAANVEQAGQVAEVPGQVQGQGQGQAPQSSQERRTIQENVQQEMSKLEKQHCIYNVYRLCRFYMLLL